MKIVNKEAYQAYDHQVNGYDPHEIKKGFDAIVNQTFVRATIALAALKEQNPFPTGSREAHLYFRIGYCYSMWRRQGIDSKVNYIRMLRAAVELAEMRLENPFCCKLDTEVEEVSLEELAEVELEAALIEDIASGTFVPAVDVCRVFGVLPSEEDDE